MGSGKAIQRRHQMHEFGTVLGATQSVRINRLENRLHPFVPFPHRHDFYHLVFVESGAGWHEIDFRRYSVTPSQLFFMRPGQVHSWRMDEGNVGFVVEFGNDALLDKKQNLAQIPNEIDFSSSRKVRQSAILGILKSMLNEYEGQGVGFEMALRYYLALLLMELTRTAKVELKKPEESDPMLDRFAELVEQYFKNEHRVSFYAKLLKTTPKAITMRVSRALGKSARAVIQDRCLLEGKRLLAYSDLSISEVGYELGFEDPNYFSRFFKSSTGKSPGDFRIQVRKV
jgi:AraC-like DNA-binding protein